MTEPLFIFSEKLASNNPSAETCLLIAGAGASARFWSDGFCQRLLNAGYDVIRYDHRDCGLSDGVDWEEAPYTVDDLVVDALQVLAKYEVAKTHVVGHSMGGIIAQMLAIAHPERLLSYTSISVATCGVAGAVSPDVMDVLLANKPAQDFTADLPGFMRSWEVLNGNYPVDYALAEAYTRDLYERSNYPVDVAWNHIRAQEKYGDLSSQLKQMTVPGLFIHGEVDPLIPVAGARATQELTSHSIMHVIPDMGHMMFSGPLQQLIAEKLIEHFRAATHFS